MQRFSNFCQGFFLNRCGSSARGTFLSESEMFDASFQGESSVPESSWSKRFLTWDCSLNSSPPSAFAGHRGCSPVLSGCSFDFASSGSRPTLRLMTGPYSWSGWASQALKQGWEGRQSLSFSATDWHRKPLGHRSIQFANLSLWELLHRRHRLSRIDLWHTVWPLLRPLSSPECQTFLAFSAQSHV